MSRPVTIALLGDIAFNGRYTRGAPGDWSKAFAAAGRMLHQADLVIGNLECAPQWGEPRPGKIPVSTTVDALGLLPHLGVHAVNLANNHVFDHGAAGFRKLTEALDRLGVKHFGAGETRRDAEGILRIRLGEKIVGLTGFCSEDTHPCEVEGLSLNLFHPDRAVPLVREFSRQVDHLIVSMHWGEEWLSMPSPEQRAIARDLIRAGARVVAGHHAHALQGWERMGGGVVFYSLGNAVFDDVRADGRLHVRQTRLTQECAVAKIVSDEEPPRVSVALGDSKHGLALLPKKACEPRITRLNRKLLKRHHAFRYAVHKRLRTFTMKYVSQYILGFGLKECFRRLCSRIGGRKGPVILYGAGRQGGYYIRNQRLLWQIYERFRGQKFILIAPKGDPLLKVELPPSVEARESSFAARSLILRVLWIQFWLPVFCLMKRASAVAGLNGFGPRWAPCERILFINNARPLSPHFLDLPDLPWKTRWTVRMQRFFMGLALKGAGRIGVQREGMIAEIRALWNIPRERFEIVPNSTSSTEGRQGSTFSFRIRSQFPGRTVFFFPALYARHKNFEFLLKAVERLRINFRKSQNILICLTLDAGSRGHEKGAAGFVGRIKDSKVRDRFLLLGEVPHDRMRALYDEADVVLYPSICDSFSAVFLEAMKRGRPILAAGVNHAREICGDAAEYFTWNDPASLAASMQRLTADPGRRAELVEKGRARIRGFMPDQEVNQMISLLDIRKKKSSGLREEPA